MFIEASGLVMMMIPTNPSKIADHLRTPTFSDKKTTARSVAKIGTVNNRAVASARETTLKPVNTHNIPTPPTAPLAICSLTEDVLTAPKPCQNKTGSKTMKTSEAR